MERCNITGDGFLLEKNKGFNKEVFTISFYPIS